MSNYNTMIGNNYEYKPTKKNMFAIDYHRYIKHANTRTERNNGSSVQ